MRRAPLTGSVVGLGWNARTVSVAGVVSGASRHALPVLEVLAEEALLQGDQLFPFLDFAGSRLAMRSSGVVLDGSTFPDTHTLRSMANRAHTLGARCLTIGVSVPAEGTGVDTVVEHARIVSDLVKMPLCLEPTMSTGDCERESAFLAELTARTDCWLVVNLTTLATLCSSNGKDPRQAIANFPLRRVAYFRVVSTSSAPLASSVADLAVAATQRWDRGAPPVLLDTNRPAAAAARELTRLGRMLSQDDLTDLHTGLSSVARLHDLMPVGIAGH